MGMKIDFPTGVIFLFGNRLYLKKGPFYRFLWGILYFY